MTAAHPSDDTYDELMRRARDACWCSQYRKPCEVHDAYGEALYDALAEGLLAWLGTGA